MKSKYLFELCAENLKAAQTADLGGADRIELCSQLAIGGVTPDHNLITNTVRAVSIPVHVLIRPRGGDFVYSDKEFALMRRQTQESKTIGAAGIAVGLLLPDGRVDIERTRQIAELAFPMKVTFHRAFDEVASQSEALEEVIQTGADCLLTSGGKPSVMEGAERIAALREQAGDRLAIMAGGGLTLQNLVEVAQRTGVHHLHGSLIRKASNWNGNGFASFNQGHTAADVSPMGEVLVEDVREAVRLFHEVPSRQLTL
jgi:copper homeostasis protein